LDLRLWIIRNISSSTFYTKAFVRIADNQLIGFRQESSLAKIWQRPCEKSKKGQRVCFWQESVWCACYKPHAEEKFGRRYPKLSHYTEVPLEHCEANYIPVLGQDQGFQRNSTLLSYRESKKKERESRVSGSAKIEEDAPLFD